MDFMDDIRHRNDVEQENPIIFDEVCVNSCNIVFKAFNLIGLWNYSNMCVVDFFSFKYAGLLGNFFEKSLFTVRWW